MKINEEILAKAVHEIEANRQLEDYIMTCIKAGLCP
jgi:hypothetical protein